MRPQPPKKPAPLLKPIPKPHLATPKIVRTAPRGNR
jgi:hypothetical protein